jgi:hypothetical protein
VYGYYLSTPGIIYCHSTACVQAEGKINLKGASPTIVLHTAKAKSFIMFTKFDSNTLRTIQGSPYKIIF